MNINPKEIREKQFVKKHILRNGELIFRHNNRPSRHGCSCCYDEHESRLDVKNMKINLKQQFLKHSITKESSDFIL